MTVIDTPRHASHTTLLLCLPSAKTKLRTSSVSALALTSRKQAEAHTRPKHNILDSEITIRSFFWPNGLRRSKIKNGWDAGHVMVEDVGSKPWRAGSIRSSIRRLRLVEHELLERLP